MARFIDFLLGSELEKYLSNRKEVEVGDRLSGRIIEIKPNGSILIEFEKFRTIAKIDIPVKVGNIIEVQVVEKGKNFKFILVDPDDSETPDGRLNVKV